MQVSNFSLIGILISALLPIILTGYAKLSGKGYNNAAPRDFLDKLEGKRKRAYFAHLNSFEAFPFFAFAVLIANINQVDPTTLHYLITIHLLSRLLYALFYNYDAATFRSLVWTSAIGCNIALVILSLS